MPESRRDTGESMTLVHPDQHLLRAKDLIDARYRDPLDVASLAQHTG